MPAPGVGAVCGSCPTGFTGDGLKCSGTTLVINVALWNYFFIITDIDECSMDGSLCDQICENTFGSYECSCNPGYRYLMNSNICEGIMHYIFEGHLVMF